MIPKTFHLVWFGKKPYKHPKYLNSFKIFHPEWKFRVWTEDNLPEGLIEKRLVSFFKDQRVAPNYRSDVARFVLVELFGGIYVDHDFQCFNKFDEFLTHTSFCGSIIKNKYGEDTPFSALFGAERNGDWIKKATAMTIEMMDSVDYDRMCYYYKDALYPISTTEQMKTCEKVYPEYYFYKDLYGFDIKYSRHYWANNKEDGWLTELKKKLPPVCNSINN